MFQVFSYLLQTLHVFEVESNVKKAEIRIYKLKLQEKGRKGEKNYFNATGKNSVVINLLTRTILMMRFFS